MIRPFELLEVEDMENGDKYWIFHRSGELSKPIQVFSEGELQTITETYNRKRGLLLRKTTEEKTPEQLMGDEDFSYE